MPQVPHRGAVVLLAAAGTVAVAVVAVLAFQSASYGARARASWVARSPAASSARARTTRHFEYVLNDHKLWVYDIDHRNRLVGTIRVPQIVDQLHLESHGIFLAPNSLGKLCPINRRMLKLPLRIRFEWTLCSGIQIYRPLQPVLQTGVRVF